MDSEPKRAMNERGLPPDAWAKYEAWRHTGPLSKAKNIRVRVHVRVGAGAGAGGRGRRRGRDSARRRCAVFVCGRVGACLHVSADADGRTWALRTHSGRARTPQSMFPGLGIALTIFALANIGDTIRTLQPIHDPNAAGAHGHGHH